MFNSTRTTSIFAAVSALLILLAVLLGLRRRGTR